MPDPADSLGGLHPDGRGEATQGFRRVLGQAASPFRDQHGWRAVSQHNDRFAILCLTLAQGLPNKQIATALAIAEAR